MFNCDKCGNTTEPREPMTKVPEFRSVSVNSALGYRFEIKSEKKFCTKCAGIKWPIEYGIKVDVVNGPITEISS